MKLEDFELISDEDNLLNDYYAVVRCITHKYEEVIIGLTCGMEYKAIGRDKNGYYLIVPQLLWNIFQRFTLHLY